ncbi:hypothetical protein ACI50E_18485 [Brucella sp. ZJ1_1]|uniref:Porin n=2 Tax=Brucella intermedia TaxID=94625 RepID=C4WNS3_9HYPH|nr:Hypothetical protein OINT_2001200 [Brucella intermedia LMG 3301]ELT50737.1 hypothetical protein D584_02626 [Brucella intermedia M86]NKB96444.1 hypothetical protein [Brucella intermedia]OOC57812.1 hypothetical protein AS855_05860 [Brucella intermedia M86]SUA86783.1 Uncharacterised protein [Brucella intermedia]
MQNFAPLRRFGRRQKAAFSGHLIYSTLLGATALLGAGTPDAFAQEKRDIFKTEIFLTPYSKLGDTDATGDYPKLNGQLLFMTGYTGYFGIKDSNGQIPRSHWNSVQPTAEAALVWQLSQQFSILSKITFDSSVEATNDNAFSDLGFNLKNLFASYTRDNFALYGGKMDIGFGDGWHAIDGLYTGFTDDFQYKGSIGLGGRYTFNTENMGAHSFAGLVFKRDDTVLDRRLSLDDGFISPTEGQPPAFSNDLNSFILTYDFRNVPGLKNISGGVDVGRLEAEPGYGEGANTISARLRYDTALTDKWNLSWFNEATFSSAFRGTPVSNGNGVTSLSLSHDHWQFNATTAIRKLSGGDERLAQYGLQSDWDWGVAGTVTYVTPIGIILQTGLVHQRDQTLNINQGVFRIAYQTGF